MNSVHCVTISNHYRSLLQLHTEFDASFDNAIQTREGIGKLTELRQRMQEFIDNLIKELDTIDRRDKAQLRSWKGFYKEYFDLDVEIFNIRIPAHKEGFDRLILVPKGLTLNKTLQVIRQHFDVYSYKEDLDKSVKKNDRNTSNSSYIVRIRDRREADEEFNDKSANQLKEQGVQGITLLERLLLELEYLKETGQHLDQDNMTLCTGSRRSANDVLYVRWDSKNDRLKVDWYNPEYQDVRFRVREVVS